ncbi:S46 family peptidase [Myxococcota bacterium]|nr:S46 family peptidase [Myxococcota bacterium]
MTRPLAAALAAVLLAALAAAAVRADEGMWTLDAFPRERVAREHGFDVTPDFLERARLASVRLSMGCSGSFVSPDGLVMTNHHCVADCLAQLSTADEDLMAEGFWAPDRDGERVCPALQVDQLVSVTDVTERVRAAAPAEASDAEANEARKAAIAEIENACSEGDAWQCQVVGLYRGGVYHLYRSRKYTDVRLVFASEDSIAYFGGDPDNFNFPRFDLDAGFLRVYEDGKPARTPDFFPWSDAGARDGDLLFLSGHPGSTDRLLTVAELEYQRDVAYPERLLRMSEFRGQLDEYSRRGTEQARTAQDPLLGVENRLKASLGEWRALLSAGLIARKAEEEAALRAKVEADPRLKAAYASAWDEVAAAQQVYRRMHLAFEMIEGGQAFRSDLFWYARSLLRAAAERDKPQAERLAEYRDAALPRLERNLLAAAPVYPEVEELRLRFGLTRLREELGTDHPLVRKVLGQESPGELAHRLVSGSRLADPEARRALWEGGAPAVAASDDPVIAFARAIDADARALRKEYEDRVEAPKRLATEKIARARFEVLGTGVYPDATFSLRMTYGRVVGWEEPDGRPVPPFTTLGGTYERATGRDPYRLPESWLKAREALPADLPFNFVTTHDIIGGNSGSPVLDTRGHVVGLVFDGNLHSLGGRFWFDPTLNRAVVLDARALLESLRTVYRADRLVREIEATRVKAGKGKKPKKVGAGAR